MSDSVTILLIVEVSIMTVYSHKLYMTELHIVKVTFDKIRYVDAGDGQPWDTFVLVLKGGVTVSNPRRTVQVSEGEIMFIPEGTRYHGVWRGEDGCEFYSLRASLGGADIVGNTFVLQKLEGFDSYAEIERFHEIHRLFAAGDRESALRGFSAYFAMYADILPYMKTETRRKAAPSVIAAVRYIDSNFQRDFSVDELAAVCHISPSRLYHLFSEQLGTTPTKYRNTVRVEKACGLLRRFEGSVEEIAEVCGFNSAAYFREIFKSETGLTPTEYRSAAQQPDM